MASQPVNEVRMSLRRASDLCFPGSTLEAHKLRLKFIYEARKHSAAIEPFLNPTPGTALSDAVRQRPDIVGAVLWPYQCAGWQTEERLMRIVSHYRVIDEFGLPWRFDLGKKLVLADLSEHFFDLRLVIDQPSWFMREGGLVLSLFKDDFRAFSLAFSFHQTPDGRLQAVIGALQGRDAAHALDLYRDITKAIHGLRPRDLLLDAFRMICRTEGVKEMLGVSQAHRHHQHPFFGNQDLTPDYDAIWKDRGGTRLDDRFFGLSLAPIRRDLETVKPNKRSLYRKRFAFLDNLDAQIARDISGLIPVSFVDI